MQAPPDFPYGYSLYKVEIATSGYALLAMTIYMPRNDD